MPPPLPADRPHVGLYHTYFNEMFGTGPGPDRTRLIDRVLPLRLAAIDAHALELLGRLRRLAGRVARHRPPAPAGSRCWWAVSTSIAAGKRSSWRRYAAITTTSPITPWPWPLRARAARPGGDAIRRAGRQFSPRVAAAARRALAGMHLAAHQGPPATQLADAGRAAATTGNAAPASAAAGHLLGPGGAAK